MTYKIVHRFPDDLPLDERGPFLSIFQTTTVGSGQSRNDSRTFKNLLKEAKEKLSKFALKSQMTAILKPLEEIERDTMFWVFTKSGLAIFANENQCLIYLLDEPVKNQVVASNSIYIKPMIRLYQHQQHYHLLCLNKDSFTIYETDGHHINKVNLDAEIKTTLKDVLGDQKTESYLSRSAGGANAVFHGQGGKNKEIDLDTEKFFRYIDKVIIDHVSKKQNFPIILVGLNKNQTIYREISNHPNLLKENIESSYESLSDKELLEAAYACIKPRLDKQIQSNIAHFNKAQASNKTSDHINSIVTATVNNEIDTLFIQSDKSYQGLIDWSKKEIIDNKTAEDNDIFDDIAEVIIQNGGKVFVLDQSYMPTTTGICAILK